MKENKLTSQIVQPAAIWLCRGRLFTGADAMLCSGTVSVQNLPAGRRCIVVDGTFIQIPETALSNGWYTFEIVTAMAVSMPRISFSERRQWLECACDHDEDPTRLRGSDR